MQGREAYFQNSTRRKLVLLQPACSRRRLNQRLGLQARLGLSTKETADLRESMSLQRQGWRQVFQMVPAGLQLGSRTRRVSECWTWPIVRMGQEHPQ